MNGFRHNVRGRIAAGALAAVGAAVLTAGCGSSSSGNGSTSSSSSGGAKVSAAAATLKRAAYVSTAASGYKVAMAMNISVTGQSSGPQTVTMTANGSISPASRTGDLTMQMELPVNGSTQTVDMNMVMDGDTMYMKMPFLSNQLPGVQPWLSMNLKQLGKVAGIPGYGSMFSSSSNFSDPGQYLDFLRAAADGSVKDLGQEPMGGGVQATHYRATVDLSKLANAVPAAERPAIGKLVSTLEGKGMNTQMPIDAWIDASHHIRRVQLSYTISVSGQTATAQITENVSDYGPQPAPTIPSKSQTTNLLSLIHGSLNQSVTTQNG